MFTVAYPPPNSRIIPSETTVSLLGMVIDLPLAGHYRVFQTTIRLGARRGQYVPALVVDQRRRGRDRLVPFPLELYRFGTAFPGRIDELRQVISSATPGSSNVSVTGKRRSPDDNVRTSTSRRHRDGQASAGHRCCGKRNFHRLFLRYDDSKVARSARRQARRSKSKEEARAVRRRVRSPVAARRPGGRSLTRA